MGARWQDHILGPDTTANRPAPADAPLGALYQNDDSGDLEINTGSAWDTYRSAVAAGVASIVEGTGISVDDTDPANPIVSATGGGGSGSLLTIDDPTQFAAAYGTPTIADEFDATPSASTLPSGYAWVNQGGASYDERLGAGVITGTSQSGDQIRAVVRSMASLGSTWTAIIKAVVAIGPANYTYGGILLRESSSGKLYSFSLSNDGTISFQNWSSASVGVSTIVSAGSSALAPPTYWKIIKGATQSSFFYSRDGRGWRQLGAAQTLSYMTPDQIGVFTGCNGGGDNQIAAHWLRIF